MKHVEIRMRELREEAERRHANETPTRPVKFLRLPFNGKLSRDEERLLEQFAFEAYQERAA